MFLELNTQFLHYYRIHSLKILLGLLDFFTLFVSLKISRIFFLVGHHAELMTDKHKQDMFLVLEISKGKSLETSFLKIAKSP